MHKLNVLGTGCPKCKKLEELTRAAADELGLDYELEKVEDMLRFADFGVMLTPALVIDGEVKVHGKLPSADELKTLLQQASA